MNQHIILRQRKTLCGRLRILDVTIPQELDPNVNAARMPFETLRNDLLRYASEPTAEQSPDYIRLDEEMEKLRQRVPVAFDYHVKSAKHRKSLASVTESVQQSLARVSCQSCAERANANICCGAMSDDGVVDATGHCLEPLRDMLAYALNETTALYRNEVANPSEIDKVQIDLSTHPLSERRAFRCAPHLLASTEINGDKSRIRLSLRADSFCKRSFLAAQYILFHECIAHVFQGARDLNDRRPTDPDDEFAEGWMDVVALQVLSRLFLAGTTSGGRGVNFQQFQQSTMLQGERVDAQDVTTNARTKAEIREERECRMQIFNGVDAAYKMLGAVGWDAFLQLSLDANLEARQNCERRQFVASIQEKLTPPVSSAAAELIQRETRNYQQSKDIRSFLRSFD